jgi:hypothetical protein
MSFFKLFVRKPTWVIPYDDRIKELEQQLAAKDAEIAALNSEVERKVSAANFLLAAKDKQIVMLRGALEQSIERMCFAEPWSAAESDIEFARNALAATEYEKPIGDNFDLWNAK